MVVLAAATGGVGRGNERSTDGLAIVLRAEASAPEQLGAKELADHLEAMCGERPPILVETDELPRRAIVVGPCRALTKLGVALDAKALGDEGFVLRTVGERLVCAGTGRRGTLYACVTLLERLGVRWFTSKVTRMPKVASLAALELPRVDEVQRPAFEYREAFFSEAFERRFASRNRLNGHSCDLDASTGGKVVYQPFVHSFDEIVPRELFAEHPEYFPWIGGRRVGGPNEYGQRCLTNPDVLQLAVAKVRGWIAANPEARIFSVSQNDCYAFCECDVCKALTEKHGAHSGLYLWFVNQVAEAIAAEYPDALIDTLAYQFTEPAPRGITPHPNVRVRVCPIACCVSHPFEQCTAPQNVAFLSALRAWSEVTDSLYVWHYTTDFHHYLMPFPNFAEFPAEARLYGKSGVKGLFFQGAYGGGGGGSDAELRSWVMARLLWDVDADVDALVSEWMQGVYGAAWKPMRAWFDRLHAEVRASDRHLFIYDAPKGAFLAPAVLEAGEKWFAEARDLASGDPVALQYVDKASLWLRYVQLWQATQVDSAVVDAFFSDLKRHGIATIAESRSMEAFEKELRAKAR